MSKFKIGDRVVAVRDVKGYDVLVPFEEYTVCGAKEGWVTLDNGYMYSDRIFELAEKACNGVDASGNPLNFTEDLLQPFQRVVDRAGRTWIVVPKKPCGKYALLSEGSQGHMEFYNTAEEASELEEYVADRVYDMPMFYDAFDHAEVGNLIWKRTKPLTEQEKAMQQLENTIKEAQEKLAALKATL